MKPIIPKTPAVPKLSEEEIAFLTNLTFGELVSPRVCDSLFVFGGTHAGHWEKAIEAYQSGLVRHIIVTGGVSPTSTPSHVTGRQWRTLAKHLPDHLNFIPFTFNATYKGISISRDTWMDTEVGKSRIWGEYLRILHYGKKGDIQALNVDDE